MDLVILNEKPPSYLQDLQAALEGWSDGTAHAERDPRGLGVSCCAATLLSPEERDCLTAAARVILLSRQGSLAEQVARAEPPAIERRRDRRPAAARAAPRPSRLPPRPAWEFDNGLGGFVEDGREYMIVLGEGQWTPAPWVNVIANERLGFQVSESGAGYTWAENSRENQLTPWSNDPVSDTPGRGPLSPRRRDRRLWGPTVLPIREEARPYHCRHGQGYSRFTHRAHGIELEPRPVRAPRGSGEDLAAPGRRTARSRPRRLTVTAYAEWVLGFSRSRAPRRSSSPRSPRAHRRAARPQRLDPSISPAAWPFSISPGKQTGWTGDRTEILGRNGTLDHPEALERGQTLSGKVGPGLDPCGALQDTLSLAAGEETEVVVLLGQGQSEEEAQTLVERYRAADLDAVLEGVKTRWDDLLAAVQVKTPDRSLDLMLNRWLLYQALACRVWARAGFYQAGGAYGFRDQLQDVMALTVAARDIARRISCARPLGSSAKATSSTGGIRRRDAACARASRTISCGCRYAVAHYVARDRRRRRARRRSAVPRGPAFERGAAGGLLRARHLHRARRAVFEHSARAIDRSLAVGPHGLPLMGTGDWNDGMNRVGPQGASGESVWLGWFLFATLEQWAPLAAARGEQRARRALAARTPPPFARPSRPMAGTATGTGAPTSTTAPRSALPRTPSAGSTRSPSPGPCCPGPPTSPARRRPWARWRSISCAASRRLVLLFSAAVRAAPSRPRLHPRLSARNPGERGPVHAWRHLGHHGLRGLGDGDRVGELFSILNP